MSWNSLSFLPTVISAVRRFSSPTTDIIVVDNGSTDGSVQWLRERRDVRTVALDRNVGHGPALDIGFLSARSRYVIALDVDAFPIAPDWIERITEPLGDGATVSGAHGGEVLDGLTSIERPAAWIDRDFVHPCCLAMELRRFVSQRHSFRKAEIGERHLDTGEAISRREVGQLHFVEPSSVRGPGALGTVFGDIVYHNFYGTRFRREGRQVVDGIEAEEASRAWEEAVARFL